MSGFAVDADVVVDFKCVSSFLRDGCAWSVGRLRMRMGLFDFIIASIGEASASPLSFTAGVDVVEAGS